MMETVGRRDSAQGPGKKMELRAHRSSLLAVAAGEAKTVWGIERWRIVPPRGRKQHLDLLFRAGTVVGLSDEQLLARFAGREDVASAVAFEALVRRHGPMVLATCRVRFETSMTPKKPSRPRFSSWPAKPTRSGAGIGSVPGCTESPFARPSRLRVATAQRRKREMLAAERTARVEQEPGWHVEREEVRKAVHQELDRLPSGSGGIAVRPPGRKL